MNNKMLKLSIEDEERIVKLMSKIEDIAVNYISTEEANCLIIDMMFMFKRTIIKIKNREIDSWLI